MLKEKEGRGMMAEGASKKEREKDLKGDKERSHKKESPSFIFMTGERGTGGRMCECVHG